MAEEKLIHVKLEYEEAVQSKKDILSLEANLLTILQTIKRYHPLRIEELKSKSKVYTRIKEIVKNLKQLERTLPKIKIPQILKEHHLESVEELEKIEEKISKVKTQKYDSTLESQLEEIQGKLKDLRPKQE